MSGNGITIGQRPHNGRQRVIKLLWTGIWLAYLSAPVNDLLHGGHSAGVRVLGWLGLVAFVAWYFALVFRAGRGDANRVVLGSLAVLTAQSTILALTLGREWLVLFVYVSVASGAALPARLARLTIPAVSGLLALLALVVPGGEAFLAGLLLPALLGGFSMSGVRELIRTTVALREARATVAQLAANEERLRLARDLHDLLGHSLSLITLKSELAGRMLPAHPEQAARQVADIEQVSRMCIRDSPSSPTWPACPRRASPCWPGRCARRSPTSYGTAVPGAARWTSSAVGPSTAPSSNSPSRTTDRADRATVPATA
ncbi:sensor histidine kinase [Streptomyces resistomycificus]|uniref:sensor histidine kinase n=1 Tax=Streptomyces resistomycificus TaxID=67356 RepID=UPI000A5A5107